MPHALPTVLDRFERPLVVTIRGCVDDDLPKLEWFGLHHHSRELIRAAYARTGAGDVVMLVADVGGFPVGQVWIDLDKKRAESVGILWALRVIPVLQNLGIGTRLGGAAERVVRQRGFATAELGVDKSNPAARRLYERLGYAVVSEEQESWEYVTPDGGRAVEHSDEWILHRPLADKRAALADPSRRASCREGGRRCTG
jgi:ribosomal protein S18 acetylase RimI-like enzyme